MTIIARLLMTKMQQQGYNDGTMGTIQPARQIRRCRCLVDARMCVDVKGRQGGGAGREKWGSKNAQTHRAIGVTEFFWTTQCTVAQQLVRNNS